MTWFEEHGLLVEAQRLYQRVIYDIEMMKEVGYCGGIENYSLHLSNRKPGSRPFCLLDYFPEDKLMIIDESHVTLPQLQAMYKADRSRKQTLIDHGFRLPTALDNRPLKFDEFEALAGQTIFVSATPGDYELKRSGGETVDQIIRPTGGGPELCIPRGTCDNNDVNEEEFRASGRLFKRNRLALQLSAQ